MNRHSRIRPALGTILGAAGALALASQLAGCGAGHGKHTTKFKEEREAAHAALKAGTTYDMAQQAYLAGDLDKALTQIDASIAMNGEVAKSHVLRGRILMEMTDFDGSLASLDRAMELDESNDEAPYFKGIVYERIAQPSPALESYRAANAIDPANPQYVVAIAEVLIDLDRLEEARAFLATNDSMRHNAGVAQTLGHIAMIEQDYQTAAEMFEHARLLAPENEQIMEDLVHAEMRTGRYAEAEFLLAQLLGKPEHESRRDLLHLRAQCLTQVDRPVEAREVLLTLTGDDAGQADVDAWIALGNVAYKLGDMARLRTSSQRVVALAPHRYEGFVLRGLYERRQGEPARALRSLNKAVELRGDDTAPLSVRGILPRELGDMAGARESFEAAWLEDPENETVHQFLALLDEQIATEDAIVNVPTDDDGN